MSRGETPRSTNALHFDDSDDRITSWSREHADDDVSITSVPPAMLGDDLDANVDVWVANTLMNESDAELRQSDSYAQALRDLNRPVVAQRMWLRHVEAMHEADAGTLARSERADTRRDQTR